MRNNFSKTKKSKSEGKVLTVFLIIIAVLLVTMTAAAVFFLYQEKESREKAETAQENLTVKVDGLEKDINQVKKEKFLLEEKNKEADDKINGLLDELELEQGLREEMKKEAASLNEKLEEAKAARQEAEKKNEDIVKFQEEISQLQSQLDKILEEKKALEEKVQEQIQIEKNRVGVSQLLPSDGSQQSSDTLEEKVDLSKIVVSPLKAVEGLVLSVDVDTEFVIVNLGSKKGINMGQILSVNRGQEYLGDIQVTRVQPEMSAADLIPPFSSRVVRKNDQVVIKP
ncbi:hypothetical protein MNBD_BACTEROID05-1311 [hydrothermal vent metagenome]|uniref:Uncharacterized protein n=1 Tax=hydrothermal vent metagenome TaxID=652676 RepID=A0A3B0TUG1_9ZZZZ